MLLKWEYKTLYFGLNNQYYRAKFLEGCSYVYTIQVIHSSVIKFTFPLDSFPGFFHTSKCLTEEKFQLREDFCKALPKFISSAVIISEYLSYFNGILQIVKLSIHWISWFSSIGHCGTFGFLCVTFSVQIRTNSLRMVKQISSIHQTSTTFSDYRTCRIDHVVKTC